ncbi:MAG: hypothetical protein ACRC8K_12550, partial [Waterburya sp.]
MSVLNDKTMNPQKRQQTINTHTKVCSYCGFTENPLNVSNCLRCDRRRRGVCVAAVGIANREAYPAGNRRRRGGCVCEASLKDSASPQDSANRVISSVAEQVSKTKVNHKSDFERDKRKSSSDMWSKFPLILLVLGSAGLLLLWRNNSDSLQQATEKTITSTTSTPAQSKANNYTNELQLTNSLTEVTNVPQGIFFYSGTMASAGIHSSDILARINKAQPQFHIAYADPLVLPPDSGVGIKMIIDGTISFAESFRPLKQSEYDLANSRGFKLKQIPIATSAIAF